MISRYLALAFLLLIPAAPFAAAQPGADQPRVTHDTTLITPPRTSKGQPIALPPLGRATSIPRLELPKARPEIAHYARLRYGLYFAAEFWGFLGLGLIIWSGVGGRISRAVERRTRFRLLHALFCFAAISLLMSLWRMPLATLGYGIERSYGFATLTPWLWLVDRGRGYLFGLALAPAVWLAYLCMERAPRRWWLWLWLGTIPWALALVVIYPVVLEPAYNDFKPLPVSPLRQRLVDLAARAGIENSQVLQVDASRRTTKLNAYMSGLGPTKRIVIWDTTLKKMTDDEIVAVMGHEIGHYVLGHIWRGFAFGVAGAFVLLWLLARLLPAAIRRFDGRTRDLHDLAALPIALLLLNLLLFVQTPVESAISRFQEHEADRYGLELTHLNEASARALIGFVEGNFEDPDPPRFIVFWFYSHPPLRERVEFALTYTPWIRPPSQASSSRTTFP